MPCSIMTTYALSSASFVLRLHGVALDNFVKLSSGSTIASWAAYRACPNILPPIPKHGYYRLLRLKMTEDEYA